MCGVTGKKVAPIKESVFSTVAQQVERATCEHVIVEAGGPYLILGHIACDARCIKCGTHRAVRKGEGHVG
jgi:hypothetical protein